MSIYDDIRIAAETGAKPQTAQAPNEIDQLIADAGLSTTQYTPPGICQNGFNTSCLDAITITVFILIFIGLLISIWIQINGNKKEKGKRLSKMWVKPEVSITNKSDWKKQIEEKEAYCSKCWHKLNEITEEIKNIPTSNSKGMLFVKVVVLLVVTFFWIAAFFTAHTLTSFTVISVILLSVTVFLFPISKYPYIYWILVGILFLLSERYYVAQTAWWTLILLAGIAHYLINKFSHST